MVHAVADNDDFDTQLEAAGKKLVVVDFHATWCGPCKMIAPLILELAATYSETVVFLKVDVDECEDLAVRYNINSMPTFLFLKEKQVVHEFSGANKDTLISSVKTHSA